MLKKVLEEVVKPHGCAKAYPGTLPKAAIPQLRVLHPRRRSAPRTSKLALDAHLMLQWVSPTVIMKKNPATDLGI